MNFAPPPKFPDGITKENYLTVKRTAVILHGPTVQDERRNVMKLLHKGAIHEAKSVITA